MLGLGQDHGRWTREQHRDSLMVSGEYLDRIKTLRPKSPHYMDRGYQGEGQLLADWNLIVPIDVLQKTWEEIR